MNFNKLENSPREETFNHYMNTVPCTYSMTVNIDITNLLNEINANEKKIFPVFLHLLSKVVNNHQEFRMAVLDNGDVGYYDVCHPCYTVFDSENETFSNKCTLFKENLNEFYEDYLLKTQDIPENIFNVSLIPWTSFTGFNLNLQKGYDYLPPIFTIGKYFNQDEKTLIPMAVQVHHSVCDGFHLSRFLNELEGLAKDFSYEKEADNI